MGACSYGQAGKSSLRKCLLIWVPMGESGLTKGRVVWGNGGEKSWWGGGEARLDEAASLKALRGAFHVQTSKGRPIRLQVPCLLRKRKERSHLMESSAIHCRQSLKKVRPTGTHVPGIPSKTLPDKATAQDFHLPGWVTCRVLYSPPRTAPCTSPHLFSSLSSHYA